MSTAKITLRPPPNVEFVQGYPGIPPGAPDRPQAAVRGSVEVRLGPSGTKAKYVRVELRKIETLPNPPPNAFYSIVGGEAPTVLWQASEEWGVLQSQDIPFHIRIPEVMPPSLSLDKGAGVKYELVGEVCVQGKTSFLRRSKPIVTSTSTPIVIDKHEFHSTWPYYQKPESRQLVHESVQLTVDRTQNCYGPGDRVSVNATIRSDALHTVILRGFEFTLKETTVFTAGLQGHSKKYQPTVKINIIGEQKLPVNATLYGGMTHRSELSVFIPDSHTTTTINSAKHIDITYVLQVKALMGTGKPLIMELPVIVSNWPRNVSAEAIRRIGFVPSLSNPVQRPAAQSSRAASSTTTGPSSTSSYDRRDEPVRQPLAITSARGHSGSANGGSDEFGVRSNSQRAIATAPVRGSNSSNGSARPDRRSSTAGAGNRFTITNAHEDEIPEEEEDHRVAPAPVPDPQPQRKPESSLQREWPSAEDEKTRLYQQAVKKVEQVQGRVERTDSTHSNRTGPRTAGPASAPVWPSAEEEKIRLFNEARNNALITQGLASAPAGGNVGHARGGSQDSSRSMRQRGFAPSSSAQGQSAALTPGAAMYSEAMSSVRKNATGTPAAWSPTRNDSTSPRPTSAGADTTSLHSAHTPPKRQYPTAEEEKEMMRRYQTATSAVRRHQESHFGSDPGASSSYGAGSSSAPAPEPVHEPAPPDAATVTPALPPIDDAPPAWAPGAGGFDEAVSEKERYRRAYEAREAAAARSAGSPPPPSIDYAAPPPPADYAEQPPPPIGGSGQQWTFTPPPSIPPHLRQRAPPAPPPSAPGRPMTAAEEKAMLRARFEEEERGSGSRSRPVTPPFNSSLSTESHAPALGTPPPPPPPPLMPRPPAEYIQETREEDERGLNGFDHGLGLGVAGFGNGDNDDTFGLKLRPSSPFVVGLDSIGRPASRAATVNGSHAMSNGMSKPPLPPKVPL